MRYISKGFDRVQVQDRCTAQIWAYVRLGIPSLVAKYLVAFDLDCTAVVRTPLACQAWKRNTYDGLRASGYSPQVGMAQGNVNSTDEWAAFSDPLLCALDMVDEGHFYYQSAGGDSRPAEDTVAADDLVSFTGTHAGKCGHSIGPLP